MPLGTYIYIIYEFSNTVSFIYLDYASHGSFDCISFARFYLPRSRLLFFFILLYLEIFSRSTLIGYISLLHPFPSFSFEHHPKARRRPADRAARGFSLLLLLLRLLHGDWPSRSSDMNYSTRTCHRQLFATLAFGMASPFSLLRSILPSINKVIVMRVNNPWARCWPNRSVIIHRGYRLRISSIVPPTMTHDASMLRIFSARLFCSRVPPPNFSRFRSRSRTECSPRSWPGVVFHRAPLPSPDR